MKFQEKNPINSEIEVFFPNIHWHFYKSLAVVQRFSPIQGF